MDEFQKQKIIFLESFFFFFFFLLFREEKEPEKNIIYSHQGGRL